MFDCSTTAPSAPFQGPPRAPLVGVQGTSLVAAPPHSPTAVTSALQLWNYIWGTWVASGSLQGKKMYRQRAMGKKSLPCPPFSGESDPFPDSPLFPSRRHFSPWVCITIVIASVGFPSIVTDALGKRRILDSLSWLHSDDLFTGGNLSPILGPGSQPDPSLTS